MSVEQYDTAPAQLRLIERACRREPEATRTLIRRLLPVIHARVRRAQVHSRELAQRDERDLVQDVWLALFAQDGRQLRQWDPDRGATLEGYVGMVVERELSNGARSARAQKRQGRLVPLELAQHASERGPTPETRALTRDTALRLADHLEENLPAKGQVVFRYLCTDELEADEVAAAMGVNRQVVYNWRHKIRQLARDFLEGRPLARPEPQRAARR